MFSSLKWNSSVTKRVVRKFKKKPRLLQSLLTVTRERETNWPIADQRVPSNNPRSLCENQLGPVSFLFLKVMLLGQFATKIFSATQHYSIVATLFRMAATLFRMVATLFQHCYAALCWKSSLQIISCNITLKWRITYLKELVTCKKGIGYVTSP